MDNGEGFYFEGARKRRSASTRRPRSESHPFSDHGSYLNFYTSPSAKPPRTSEGVQRRQRLILQENSDDEDDFSPNTEQHFQDSPKHSLRIKIPPAGRHSDSTVKDIRTKNLDGGIFRRIDTTNGSPPLPVRKSSRIPKKYLPEDEYVEDEDDYEAPQSRRKLKSERGLEELYQDDEDDKGPPSSNEDSESSDSEIDDVKTRKADSPSFILDSKKVPLTARQRAVQFSRTVPEARESLIEFPDGLPHFSQRKRQEKIPEFEQQLKKADAAQRRRMQAEKAAQKIQDDAIKKILGQDTLKQKREEKLRRQRDEMAQEKRDAAKTIAPNTIRWVIGPSGTVVSFSEDAEFLGIFNNVPCRYPPAREKCAGPSCNNTYKYRDSKSNLPLCSLLCYRAIHDMAQPLSTH